MDEIKIGDYFLDLGTYISRYKGDVGVIIEIYKKQEYYKIKWIKTTGDVGIVKNYFIKTIKKHFRKITKQDAMLELL